MSEFACRNGHIMPSGKLYCPECGCGLHTMDGYTNADLIRMDRETEERERERENEEDEDE